MGLRKYFDTTTLVAMSDHALGISTLFCSKTTLPFSLVIDAERISQSISSHGLTPARVKYRLTLIPHLGLSWAGLKLGISLICGIMVAMVVSPFSRRISICSMK